MKWLRLAVAAFLLTGCSKTQPASLPPAAPNPSPSSQTITLATTTSTRDSGLLDALLPVFAEVTGIEVKVVAVGSGQALELGRRGDADVLLTHAPGAEQKFMDEGYGDLRHSVMHNDFVLLGPASNAAAIEKDAPIADAFRRLAETNTPFVSRGDESGTHMKEKTIWSAAAVDPQGEWYIQAGDGMAAVLRMASEKQACTLSDRGTFLALRDSLDLAILSEGDPLLMNPYAVMVVSAATHPHVQHAAATEFAEFLISPQAQDLIKEFGVEKYGQPLFFPRSSDTPAE